MEYQPEKSLRDDFRKPNEFVEKKVEEFDEFAQGESGALLTIDPTDYPDVREWVKTSLLEAHAEGAREERAKNKIPKQEFGELKYIKHY